jgi:A/G-specific adenine glycosylase
MDYGSYLKQATGNASRRSRHYTRQSAFQGSRRQLRGAVLRNLSSGPQTIAALSAELADERLESVLDDLLREGLINRRGKTLML